MLEKIKIMLNLKRLTFEELTALKTMIDKEYKHRKVMLERIKKNG